MCEGQDDLFPEDPDNTGAKSGGDIEDTQPIHVLRSSEAAPKNHVEIVALRNFGVRTVASEEHPEVNQDSALHMGPYGIFGVFDGVGGNSSGDEASRIACRSTQEYLKKWAEYFQQNLNELTTEKVQTILFDALRLANQKVNEAKSEGNNMATTGSLAWVVKDSRTGGYVLVTANVGDSRVYTMEGESLHCCTLDDNARFIDLSEEEAWRRQQELDAVAEEPGDPTVKEDFEKSNFISKALGFSLETQPTVRTYRLNPDKDVIIVLSSDGVHDNLTFTEIEAILKQNSSESSVANSLVERSQERSRDGTYRSKIDDITAVVINIPRVEQREEISSLFPEVMPDGTKVNVVVLPDRGSNDSGLDFISSDNQYPWVIAERNEDGSYLVVRLDSDGHEIGRKMVSERDFQMANPKKPYSIDKLYATETLSVGDLIAVLYNLDCIHNIKVNGRDLPGITIEGKELPMSKLLRGINFYFSLNIENAKRELPPLLLNKLRSILGY